MKAEEHGYHGMELGQLNLADVLLPLTRQPPASPGKMPHQISALGLHARQPPETITSLPLHSAHLLPAHRSFDQSASSFFLLVVFGNMSRVNH